MPTILMPALSPTMEEGKLAKWLKNVGDNVKPGDMIAEIETDKATMEVEAVDEGPLTEILIAAGTENVKVNTPIAVIGVAMWQSPHPALARHLLPQAGEVKCASPLPAGEDAPRSGAGEGPAPLTPKFPKARKWCP